MLKIAIVLFWSNMYTRELSSNVSSLPCHPGLTKPPFEKTEKNSVYFSPKLLIRLMSFGTWLFGCFWVSSYFSSRQTDHFSLRKHLVCIYRINICPHNNAICLPQLYILKKIKVTSHISLKSWPSRSFFCIGPGIGWGFFSLNAQMKLYLAMRWIWIAEVILDAYKNA